MALITKTANCGTMDDWYKAQGRRYSYTTTPKPGDIVHFDWNGNHKTRDHCGFVESVEDNGNTIITIEGNTAVGNDSNGGAVMRRTRYRSQVTSYNRPAYASDAERDAFLALARSQIGTVESPANSNKVKFNTWFYGKVVSGSAYPWCAVFVVWVLLSGSATTAAATEKYGKAITIKANELSKGSYGAQVKHLQRIIYARGIDKTLASDGDFGEKTEAGVIKLQKQLFPNDESEWDGIVGEKTWDAIQNKLW